LTDTRKLVAILAANPALTSILAKPLANEAGLRVCEFESGQALVTFMRISPLDLIIVDADTTDVPAADFVQALRANPRLASPHFDIIALTRAPGAFHQALLDAWFDDIITKPVATAQLVDCVTRRLALGRTPAGWDGIYRGPERRGGRRARQALNPVRSESRPSNVIPLFGRDRASRR
jgi:two-component system phosphate regulon response regulator PhoB